MTETKTEPITLYYRQGSSDKVYQAAIEPSGPGFVVTFAYGRRGSTLTTGTKTAQPVGFDEAQKIFDKLVKEKTAKGYTPGESGTPYQQTSKEDRATGIVPQLLNAIDEVEAERLIDNPLWLIQEKLDGRRTLIRRSGDSICGINRQGLVIDLPQPIADCARRIPSMQFLIDGECLGDVFVAFDLLEYACVNLRAEPYRQRLDRLYQLPIAPQNPIRFVQTASKRIEKRRMLERLRRENKEGIVFKRVDAPYTPGRPASGGDWLKLKFTTTCSCIVAGTNGSKRSVKLELLDSAAGRVSVGNVTVPANQAVPTAGKVIEVRYLYAYPGGALFQPVYLGLRDDVTANDCRLLQLKYRAENDPDDN